MKKHNRVEQTNRNQPGVRELTPDEMKTAAGGYYDWWGWSNANPYAIPGGWMDMYDAGYGDSGYLM